MGGILATSTAFNLQDLYKDVFQKEIGERSAKDVFTEAEIGDFLSFLERKKLEYAASGQTMPETDLMFAKWKFLRNYTANEGTCEYETHLQTFPKPNSEGALVLLERVPDVDRAYCKARCTKAGSECAAVYYDTQYPSCTFFYHYDKSQIQLWSPIQYDLYVKSTCSEK